MKVKTEKTICFYFLTFRVLLVHWWEGGEGEEGEEQGEGEDPHPSHQLAEEGRPGLEGPQVQEESP